MSDRLIFCCDLARRDPSGQWITRLEGWCIASSPLSALYLQVSDDEHERLPLGFSRPDVGQAYPRYPEAKDGGFRLSLASSELR